MNDSSDEKSTRRGRARERIQRRQQRREQRDAPPAVPTTQHLDRVKRIRVNLGALRIPGLQYVLYVALGVFVIFLVITFLRNLAGEDVATLPPNAIWIGTEWTYALHEEEAITGLVDQLRDHEIGTVYAWVSWVQADNTWRGAENFGAVRAFAQQFKAAYPEAQLYGWLGFPVEGAGIPYRLDDVELQENIADFGGRVVSELGFDGLFLNVEPVWSDDDSFLDLLREVRTSVGESVPISVAIPPDWSPLNVDIPVPPLIEPGTVWSKEYKQSVALLVDQMAVMAYNSGLDSALDYSSWMAYQVEAYIDAISDLGIDTALIIGVPTYDAEPPGHDPAVENVLSAVAGITAALERSGDTASLVNGIALYAGWTTDDAEWADFNEAWVQR